jgi:hypothetical protein
MRTSPAAVRDLADILVVEYAGAVPPGQVVAMVYRVAVRLAAVPELTPAARLETCEIAVRRALADRIAAVAHQPTHAA